MLTRTLGLLGVLTFMPALWLYCAARRIPRLYDPSLEAEIDPSGFPVVPQSLPILLWEWMSLWAGETLARYGSQGDSYGKRLLARQAFTDAWAVNRLGWVRWRLRR